MTTIQSNLHNLFTSIFPDESQSPSLIIKFLLVLEAENLIPLFNVNQDQNNSTINAFIDTQNNEIIPVNNIILQCLKQNQSPFFFGSNFLLELTYYLNDTIAFNSFLIFTQEGLLLEFPPSKFNPIQNQEKYQLISWDYWDNVSLSFAENQPKCTLIFNNKKGDSLKINSVLEYQSETEQIEQQLPLIFVYFIMKKFWKYVKKYRHEKFFVFNPQDFLYLDKDRLTYFIKNILHNINITETDLDNLIRKIQLT